MRDLAEVLDAALRLPIRGTTYVVQPPGAAAGLRLAATAALSYAVARDEDADLLAEALVIDDEKDARTLLQLALGDAYDRMVADDVPHPYLEHAGMTAFIHWTLGRASGEAFWESGGKLQAAQAPPTPTASTSTGAASTTKRPGSGSGTKSRPKSGTSGRKNKRKKTGTK